MVLQKGFKKAFWAFFDGKGMGKVGQKYNTDGRNFYFDRVLLAKRLLDDAGNLMYAVIARESVASSVVRVHIDALMSGLPKAQIVQEGSILTWDFKFSDT